MAGWFSGAWFDGAWFDGAWWSGGGVSGGGGVPRKFATSLSAQRVSNHLQAQRDELERSRNAEILKGNAMALRERAILEAMERDDEEAIIFLLTGFE